MGEVEKIAAELGIEPDGIENDQCYKATVSKLYSHMNQLKRQLANIQQKILEMEKPKPNKLTPKSFPYITIP
ncbi:MAG: hypothetical protein JJP05_05640 [cyanobacterium endosymbiont of Rhopalodia gibba]|jgi:hypothetical protein